MARRTKKLNVADLVQDLIDAAVSEGWQEARGTYPMQGAYDRTHAARDALMGYIERLPSVKSPTKDTP